MTAPNRIQLRRTKDWRKPEGAIVVTRATRWGNPWAVRERKGLWWIHGPFGVTIAPRATKDEAAAVAIDLYRQYVSPAGFRGIRPTWTHDELVERLRGHDLACFCGPTSPCHADVLLELANGDQP